MQTQTIEHDPTRPVKGPDPCPTLISSESFTATTRRKIIKIQRNHTSIFPDTLRPAPLVTT